MVYFDLDHVFCNCSTQIDKHDEKCPNYMKPKLTYQEAEKSQVFRDFKIHLDLIKKDDTMKEASPGAQIVSAAFLCLVSLLQEKLGDKT